MKSLYHKSIRYKFVIWLAGVVTVTLFLFSAIALFITARNTNAELHEQMDQLISIAEESLTSALWQYNDEYISNYIDSIFLYNDVVYASVTSNDQVIKVKTRAGYEPLDFSGDRSFSGYILERRKIYHDKSYEVGQITLALSKQKITQQLVYGSIIFILLLVGMNIFVFITIYAISNAFLFSPLSALESSVTHIATGNLDAPIPKDLPGEIGRLAASFSKMIANIKSITASRDELNHEVEERINAEAALVESRKTMLSILDGIDATVFVGDYDTHEILFMNRFMIDLYGKDLTSQKCWEEFREFGKPCPGCPPPLHKKSDDEHAGTKIWSGYNPKLKKWFMNHERPIKWIDGRYVRLQIATDITAMKEMEDELRQAHKMESIGRLAGGIAHDFNNILAAINGFSQFALDGVPPDSQAALDLKVVVNSSNRAAKLVKQILSFSRKEHQELSPLLIQKVLADSVKMLRATLPATIIIEENIAPDCGPIFADATMLNQVILNLCTNAGHAMEESGGILSITLESIDYSEDSPTDLTAGEHIKLTISDTGSGISESNIKRIFDPYFTTKDIGQGSGMGLAIVHGVIQSHGGVCRVESKLGKGSIFTIYFPAADIETDEDSQVQEDLPEGNETILVVDDEETITALTGRRLKKLGYTVFTLTNPTRALKFVQDSSDKIDLVITDQTMPGLRGDELAARIRETQPDLPVIICSGYSSKMNPEKALKAGIEAFIMKPVQQNILARTVRQVLDNKD